ncbi:MAG: hypothetical protein ACNFW9_02985 [Candidatus Kerfeldbacteria bacterium]
MSVNQGTIIPIIVFTVSMIYLSIKAFTKVNNTKWVKKFQSTDNIKRLNGFRSGVFFGLFFLCFSCYLIIGSILSGDHQLIIYLFAIALIVLGSLLSLSAYSYSKKIFQWQLDNISKATHIRKISLIIFMSLFYIIFIVGLLFGDFSSS